MTKRTTTMTRVEIETNEKAKQLARELAVIQQDKVPIHEVFRRAFNVPNLDEILKMDAENKRRMKK